MSKEMREQIDRVKNWKEFLNENVNDFTKNSVIKDVVYHGTWKRFDNFEKSSRGSYGKGFYFFKNEQSATAYGSIIMRCLIDIRNPFYLNENTFKEWSEKYYSKNISKITEKLLVDGYDSVITENEIVIFDNNRIKILN